MSAGDWTNAAGIAPTLITTTNGTASWPDWMNAPIRPIQLAKLDDLEAKTAEQRDWLDEPLPSNLQKYMGAQAARIAFGKPAPAPKPKKPAGPPILPLDTPRRFFED